MVIADRPKSVLRSLHRVATDCPVHMEVDESGGKEIAIQINCLLRRIWPRQGDLRDPAILYLKREALLDPIGEHQSAIGQDHAWLDDCVYQGGSPSSSCKNDSRVRCHDPRRRVFGCGYRVVDETPTAAGAHPDCRKGD